VVHVRIGRVEVIAPPVPSPPVIERPQPAQSPAQPLSEYLKRRSEGRW
jgi:hypothetical protein